MWHQGRISRRDDDDRSEFLRTERVAAGAKFFADRDTGDYQLVGTSAIQLDQDSQPVAGGVAIELARRGADPALPSVADYAGATAHASFDDASAARALDHRMRVPGAAV